MKLYYFIVWNHGIQYIRQILNIIRDTSNMQINKIIKKQPNLNNFLEEVYKFDKHVSREHIFRKNKFLLENPSSEMYLILVENHNENIKQMPSGKIYCENFENLKWFIRQHFNPRYKDKNFDPYPGANKLTTGIKHQHIIHSCDVPEETEHILKVLDLYDLNYYIRNPCSDPTVHVPSRLKPNFDFSIQLVKLNSLKCSLANGDIINIECTPHYKYLHGNKEEYTKYIMDNLGINIKDDHLPEAYDKLIQTFDYDKLYEGKKSYIICYPNMRIKDGLHRACILKKNKVEEIVVMILQD